MVSPDEYQILSRSGAIEQGLKHYYTGKPCKNGHISKRFVSTCGCVECNTDWMRNYYKEKPEIIRRAMNKYQDKNPDFFRTYQANYRKNNKHKRNSWDAKRRAAKLNATPPWADLEAIEEIYNLATWMTRENGIEYHVDHIEPLQGENSCGLHVHYNLQVLPAMENSKKGNKLRTYNEA